MNILSRFAVCVSVVCLGFLLPNIVKAETFMETSVITENTTWTKLGSPYVIQSSLLVEEGVTLTMEPGTIVKFDIGRILLSIKGKLEIMGSANDPVYLTSYYDDTVGGDTDGDEGQSGALNYLEFSEWNLDVLPMAGATAIRNAVLSYSSYGSSIGAFLSDQGVVIENVDINHIQEGFAFFGGKVDVNNVRFVDLSSTALMFFNDTASTISSVTVDGGIAENSLFLFFDESTSDVKNITTTGLVENDVIGVYDNSDIVFDEVHISSLGQNPALSLYGKSQVTLQNSTITDGIGDGINVYTEPGGSLSVSSTTISNFQNDGLAVYGQGSVRVERSVFDGNNIGVTVYSRDPDTINVTVDSSTITNSDSFGMLNISDAIVDARNVWWGSLSGPWNEDNTQGEGNAVSAGVLYEPWLESDPFTEADPVLECCSSVAFIPGLQGSRLYKDSTIFNQKTKLWEPNKNSDVEQLMFDENGESIQRDIYTEDIINKAYNFLNIDVYSSFTDSMDGLVSDNTINEWKAFPYDWRHSYDHLINNEIRLSTTTYNIVDELIDLAGKSMTGKVTIVAHSNGGLFTKAIIQHLEKLNLSGIVDKVIFVAVPQVGTPSSVAALLHGDGVSIAGGFFLNKKVAREFGENMPAVYNLLPSEHFFSRATQPIIAFDSSLQSIGNNFISTYGSKIDNVSEMESFVLGKDGREKPINSDLKNPNILNKKLLTGSASFHSATDNWLFPEHIELIQIAGWGKETVNGLIYEADGGTIDYKASLTKEGDGTVVYESAIFDSGYFINLDMFNTLKKKNVSHAFIFEVDELQMFIRDIIKGTHSDYQFISENKPIGLNDNIVIEVHSPVEAHIYDTNGNHTGIIDDLEGFDMISYEEEIPNSYYIDVGGHKYIGAGLNSISEFRLRGEQTGTFSIKVTKIYDGKVVDAIDFMDIPVVEDMVGVIKFISSTQEPVLQLDIDKDGILDAEINSSGINMSVYLEIIKRAILDMGIDKKIEKKLINKIGRLVKLSQKEKNEQVVIKLNHLLNKIGNDKKAFKRITSKQKTEIVTLFDQLLSNLK